MGLYTIKISFRNIPGKEIKIVMEVLTRYIKFVDPEAIPQLRQFAGLFGVIVWEGSTKGIGDPKQFLNYLRRNGLKYFQAWSLDMNISYIEGG